MNLPPSISIQSHSFKSVHSIALSIFKAAHWSLVRQPLQNSRIIHSVRFLCSFPTTSIHTSPTIMKRPELTHESAENTQVIHAKKLKIVNHGSDNIVENVESHSVDAPTPRRNQNSDKLNVSGKKSKPQDRRTKVGNLETAADGQKESDDKGERIGPKRKVALLMGFCGTNYQGMQVNPGTRSIEGELFKALVGQKLVSEANSVDQKKIGFARAARTDKGVHAAGQVVSLKLVYEHLEDPVKTINDALPEDIRVWGINRTVNSFHAKQQCDGRIYEYILPTYMLTPDPDFHSLPIVEPDVPPAPIDASELNVDRSYRVSSEQVEKLRNVLQLYVGTKNYHNFTTAKKFADPSSKRYIVNFTASDPEILYFKNDSGELIDAGEWISCKVKGQSFMLHQIRKMIGLAVLMVRTNTPLDVIPKLFENLKVNVPKAPGLGLLLEQTLFATYNMKASKAGKEPIDFDQYKDTIDEFKKKFIYDKIIKEEFENNTFEGWLTSISAHRHDYRYLNTSGDVITPENIVDDAEPNDPADGDDE